MPEGDLVAQAGEREMLTGFLDLYRGIVERKVEGLALADSRREMTPTGLSILGVVKHLAWVEYYWFRDCFAGESVEPPPREGGDNAVQFRIGPEDTVERVIEFYRREVEHSREVTSAASSLDQLSARENRLMGAVSLRWILVHMVEETARHAGHLDVMRESIDGRTGYL